jgi:hypothetical protein
MPDNTAENAASAQHIADSASILIRAQAFVDRKYVTRSDARQQEMGLAYVEAERQDLAREITRFVCNEIAAVSRVGELLDSLSPEGLALDKQPTGYTASIFLGLDGAVGKWTERVWASSASEAIEKALRAVSRPTLAPSQEVAPAPVVSSLAPPPY